jgi:hypothetical protein
MNQANNGEVKNQIRQASITELPIQSKSELMDIQSTLGRNQKSDNVLLAVLALIQELDPMSLRFVKEEINKRLTRGS